jgi:ATP-dependent Lon protease
MDQTPPSNLTAPILTQLPNELPVMVLPDCYLFPGGYLPLFIFEERYRLLLAHALRTERMICIGTQCTSLANGKDEVVQVSCAGMVRACVKQGDGTSHLMLMGVQRVRFTGWQEPTPYCVANIEPIHSIRGDDALLIEMRDEALSLLPACPSEASNAKAALLEQLRAEADPELICDILTYNFVHRPSILRASLAEAYVPRRYELLLSELKRRQAQA